MKQKLNRGFTLIELLVVIAIIGILASVVLASLNTARDKGANAAAISNVNNARAQAELYYADNSNSYSGVCTAAGDADPAGISSLKDAAGSAVTASATCSDNGSTWGLEVELNSGDGFFCVDYTGKSTSSATTVLTGTAPFTCG